MSGAGEEQEELLHVLRSSVGNVACSMRKDTVLHGAKSAKGVSARITSYACAGACTRLQKRMKKTISFALIHLS